MNPVVDPRKRARARFKDRLFKAVAWIVAGASLAIIAVLFGTIGAKGFEHLDLDFISDVPSRSPDKAGMGPAIMGSIWICAVCAGFALPLGVGTAIILEEYKPRRRVLKRLHGFVQLNIANLAGVPSIVYGIIGLTVFVQMFGVFGNAGAPSLEVGVSYYDEFSNIDGDYLQVEVAGRDAPPTVLRDGMKLFNDDGAPITVAVVDDDPNEADIVPGMLYSDSEPDRVNRKSWYYLRAPFGRGVLAGGLTLMLVILPVVIISSQEAIRAVPNSLREGAFGLGSTKWQVVRRITLPSAIPGIMTGAILAMSRAIGEAAPILILAGIVYITFSPEHLMDNFTAMPLQIYDWAGRPQQDFHRVAASGIIVLLAILLTVNGAAVFVRQKFQKPLQ